MQQPVRIVITMEGGVIQSIATLGVPVHATVIDYDVEGADPSETVLIPQDHGPPEPACVSDWPAGLLSAVEIAWLDNVLPAEA